MLSDGGNYQDWLQTQKLALAQGKVFSHIDQFMGYFYYIKTNLVDFCQLY